MKRIEREPCFPPEVVAMFREAERKRRKPVINWPFVLGVAFMFGSAWLIVWGVARAIDKGF